MIDYRCRSLMTCVARTPDASCAVTRPDTLCHACCESIQEKSTRLNGLADMLYLFVGGGLKSTQEARVSGSKTATSPLNVHVLDMVDSLHSLAYEVGGVDIRDIITQEGGTNLALRVRVMHDRAENMLGLHAQWHKRHVPCWECGLPTLGSWGGSDIVQCQNCHVSIPSTTYAAMVRGQSEIDKRKKRNG